MNVLRRIIRGCRYSERYGHHPGTVSLIGLGVLGWIGAGWGGAVIMILGFGVPYLVGADARGGPQTEETRDGE